MELDRDIDKIREEYDLLKYCVFLNAAMRMIPGNYWLKASQDFLDFQRRGRVELCDVINRPFLPPTYYECLERAAKLIHAKPNEVTYMYRVVTAANLIINMLDWKKTDNIVFTDLAYPSIPFILLGLQKKTGVELRRIKNVSGEILMSDLEEKVNENTKLVCINHTTPCCGFTYDVKEVCRIAHKNNALVLDDAFQALGAIEIDVHKDNVDFLISGSYKWQCGPEGAGVFYIREDLIEKFDDGWRNYWTAEYPGSIPFTLPDHDNIKSWDYPTIKSAERFNQGICVGPSIFGWNETLKFLDNLGAKNIEQRVRKLGGYLIEKLQDTGCQVLTPIEPERRHGLIVYTTGSFESDLESYNRFTHPPQGEKPIIVSRLAVGGIGGIRVSTHFFNTEEDIDTLIKVQRELMAHRELS